MAKTFEVLVVALIGVLAIILTKILSAVVETIFRG